MCGVAGVILAAGKSSRMGTMKLLLEFHGKPILQHVLENAMESSLSRIIVVLGNSHERIMETIDFTGARVVVNPDFSKGQSTSLKTGIAALDKCCEGALFMLGDQPLIDSGTIDAILEKYRQIKAPIVVPVFARRPGNPVFFHRRFFDEILELEGDVGARTLLKLHRESIVTVEVAHEGIHLDVDTWGDYQVLQKMDLGRRG